MDQELDARGLKCPLPVLKAKRALKALDAGDTLTVLATDSSAVEDFQNFCQATGDELIRSDDAGGVLTFVIKKSG